jgi:predicted ATP-grasp superfamily ATP-dependent carboligase
MAVKPTGRAGHASDPLVLMGFADAMAAIETAWSLQDAGFRVAAFRRSGTKPAVRHVRGVELYDVPAPEVDAFGSVAAVRQLCERLAPAALLPLDDHAVWVCSQQEDPRVPLAGAYGTVAEYALDKSLQFHAAAKAGIPVPETRTLEEFSRAQAVSYPVMVKPARALYLSGDVLRRPTGVVCADQSEFEEAAARPWPGPVLVQPLLHGVGEGLFGHMTAQGVIGWSAHRRVRMVNPQGSASSACRSVPPAEELLEAGERFLSDIGWRGMFMLEFLRDTAGQAWLMELNGRPWGSLALARRRGFEYPAWSVQATIDPSFQPVPPSAPPQVRCRNLGLELVHLAFVARGPQSSAAMEWPSLGGAARGVFTFTRGDRLYNWNRSQPLVLVADTLATLHTYGRKITKSKP